MQNSQTRTAPLPTKHTSTPLALGLFTGPHLDNLHGVVTPAHGRKKTTVQMLGAPSASVHALCPPQTLAPLG